MKSYTLALLLLATGNFVEAQKIWLTPFAGYTFRENITFSSGSSAEIADGAHYGFLLEYMVKPKVGIELAYQRQDTKATSQNFISIEPTKLAIQYTTIGFLRHHYFTERINGYAGLNLGIATSSNKDLNTNYSRLAAGFRLGCILKPSRKISLRIQGQVLSVVQGFNAGLYAGTGGAGAGVSTYSTIFQWGLAVGIGIGIGR
jgi:hypothetical protein